MEPSPESQRALMDPDPLQWLWDGVYDFQTKFNDLRTRAMRNFQRPADVARHDDDCGLKNSQTRMPCSCCKGALTFDEVRFVKEKLTSGRAVPNTKPRKFEGVPATACWGIENCKELFGLGSDKEALSAAFEAGTDDTKGNLLFGSSGIVSRTLDHWRELLDDAFKLIESLRAELFKSRAETQKALGEKEKAESECIHAKLKLDQMRPAWITSKKRCMRGHRTGGRVKCRARSTRQIKSTGCARRRERLLQGCFHVRQARTRWTG